jgi:hypothetical protein
LAAGGVNAALFSAAGALLLKKLPVEDPEFRPFVLTIYTKGRILVQNVYTR